MSESTARKMIGMVPSQWRSAGLCLSLASLLVLVLLVGGCASAKGVEGCIEQSDLALEEILEGTLYSCSPGVAAWELEEARACGWVIDEDFLEGG